MPTYEFKCSKCDAYGSAQFGIHDEKSMDCPTCKTPMDRYYSAPAGVIFRGGGWGGQ